MKVEQVVCDECKVVRGETNHWHKIGVLQVERKGDSLSNAFVHYGVQLTIGIVPEKPMPGYEVHDICGLQCFDKHIHRLLGNLVEIHSPERIEATVTLPSEMEP